MYSIITSKKDGKWIVKLCKRYKGSLQTVGDAVISDNYTDAMIEAADNGWIDLINKNS